MNFNSYNERRKSIRRIIFWTIIIGGLLALFFAPTLAGEVRGFAQEADGPIDVCKLFDNCIDGTQNIGTGRQAILDTIVNVVRFFIFISVGVAVLLIIFGAYQILTSAGVQERYENGLKTVRNSVIGLILAILSLTITNIVSQIVSGFRAGSTGLNASSFIALTQTISGFMQNLF